MKNGNLYYLLRFLLIILVMHSTACLAPARPDYDQMQLIAVERYGESAGGVVAAWRQLLRDLSGQPIDTQLAGINDFFNRRVIFAEDLDIWGVPDYWATPLETMGRGRGDCEDFSIAKYISLRLLGVSDEKLRLIYVSARIGGMFSQVTQAHMVLGYYPQPEAEPLILDNLISEIRSASRRPDLQPVFSFNSDGLWVAGTGSAASDSSSRLSRWRDVMGRMHNEGLTLNP